MTHLKPIVDPHAGQYQVVVSFRVKVPDHITKAASYMTGIEDGVRELLKHAADLDVAVREIGASGESSEDEGRYDRPAALGNTDDIEHAHPITDIHAEGNRL